MINVLFKKITYFFRIMKYKKYFVINCPFSDIKIMGKIYFFGNPKIILNGPVFIFPLISFAGDGFIKIGHNVSIGKSCSLYASFNAGISIGDNVSIAANTYIIDCNHKYKNRNELISKQGLDSEAIIIQDDVWIATGCTILKGSTIKNGSVVGAMTLVNGTTEEYSVNIGIPFREIKTRRNIV